MQLRAALVAIMLVLIAASGAGAQEQNCRWERRQVSPGVFKLVLVCDGGGGGGPVTPPPIGDDPPDNDEGPPPADPVGDLPPQPVCTDQGANAPDADSLFREVRADGSTWVQHLFRCEYPDGRVATETRMICIDNCPAADPGGGGPAPVPVWRSVPDLRLEALGKVDPSEPGVRHSFDAPAESGDVRAIVLAEQWWWAEGQLQPISGRAADGPVWVEVTATPGDMLIDPGDGSGSLSCATPGVAYNRNVSYYDQTPGEPRGACVHVYESLSEAMTATMSITWTVTWEGFTPVSGAVSGTLDPIVRSQSVTFPVREIQSVITASN